MNKNQLLEKLFKENKIIFEELCILLNNSVANTNPIKYYIPWNYPQVIPVDYPHYSCTVTVANADKNSQFIY
jgi:hypothetical protein